MAKPTTIWLAFGLILAILLLAAGYYVWSNGRGDDGSGETILTVDTGVSVGVQVLDLVNNKPVPGAAVYLVACCPNNTSLRDLHLEGVTGDDGWALFAVNYTLDPDQTIYLGASNREDLVGADLGRRDFNGTGYLGPWEAFDYSVLYNSEDNKALVSCTITVDLDSGRMI